MDASLHEFIDDARRAVNAGLTRLTADWYMVHTLREAASHALWGGKRLRPILALMAARTIKPGLEVEPLIPIACALELVHIFTLVHDDLPEMDNALTRHGRECTHVKFGAGVGVLAGDALLNQAFGVVQSSKVAGLTAERRLAIIGHIARACATVVEGQVLDLELGGKQATAEDIESLHLMKTAALLEGCCLTGVELAGGNASDAEKMSKFARHFGLAYQIKDDLLSHSGDEAVVGKTLGSDEAMDKATFPRILGAKKSLELLDFHTAAAVQAAACYGDAGFLLAALAHWGKDRDM